MRKFFFMKVYSFLMNTKAKNIKLKIIGLREIERGEIPIKMRA